MVRKLSENRSPWNLSWLLESRLDRSNLWNQRRIPGDEGPEAKQTIHSFMAVEHRKRARSLLWLYVGFALTGVGTTLFGCILPALNLAWHLDDRTAGILFAAQFAGSASGALLVSKNFFRSLVRGYLLLIAGAVCVAFLPGFMEVSSFLAF